MHRRGACLAGVSGWSPSVRQLLLTSARIESRPSCVGSWRVIRLWMAYAMVYLIMLLGVFLLAPTDQLTFYKNRKIAAEAVEAVGSPIMSSRHSGASSTRSRDPNSPRHSLTLATTPRQSPGHAGAAELCAAEEGAGDSPPPVASAPRATGVTLDISDLQRPSLPVASGRASSLASRVTRRAPGAVGPPEAMLELEELDAIDEDESEVTRRSAMAQPQNWQIARMSRASQARFRTYALPERNAPVCEERLSRVEAWRETLSSACRPSTSAAPPSRILPVSLVSCATAPSHEPCAPDYESRVSPGHAGTPALSAS